MVIRGKLGDSNNPLSKVIGYVPSTDPLSYEYSNLYYSKKNKKNKKKKINLKKNKMIPIVTNGNVMYGYKKGGQV
jgi:hypothetical protein